MNERYKNLEIYSIAKELVVVMYKLCETLPSQESNNLSSQLRRASTSLPLNIAEGSGAASYRGFLFFLLIAYKSSLEIEAILDLIVLLNYKKDSELSAEKEAVNKFMRKLWCYMKYVEQRVDLKEYQRSAFAQGRSFWKPPEEKTAQSSQGISK